MVFTQDGKVVMSYAEYDQEWELAQKIYEASLNDSIAQKKCFYADIYYPRAEEIESHLKKGKLKDYFNYLFFYYVQKVDVRKEDQLEYEEAMKVLKTVMDNVIVFLDEDEEES